MMRKNKIILTLLIWTVSLGCLFAAQKSHRKPVKKHAATQAKHHNKPVHKDTAKTTVIATAADTSDTAAIAAQNIDSTIYERVDTLVKTEDVMPKTFASTKENLIIREELLYPYFEKVMDRKQPARILHLGDSHLRGHILPVYIKKTLENEWGEQAMLPKNISYKTNALAIESGKPGFVYHAWGKNGATCNYFCDTNRIATAKSLNPDLIILSFGTNEAHVVHYKKELHLKNMTDLVTKLKEACPDAIILLTTPPGSYYTRKIAHYKNRRNKKGKIVKKKYYTYIRKINANLPLAVQTIKEYADENNLPVWDLYEIAGGETNACNNWVNHKLMKEDRVHFTPNGYVLQGKLLGEALLNAYNNNIKKNVQKGKSTSTQKREKK